MVISVLLSLILILGASLGGGGGVGVLDSCFSVQSSLVLLLGGTMKCQGRKAGVCFKACSPAPVLRLHVCMCACVYVCPCERPTSEPPVCRTEVPIDPQCRQLESLLFHMLHLFPATYTEPRSFRAASCLSVPSCHKSVTLHAQC